MDLQEKLDEITNKICKLAEAIENNKSEYKELKKKQKEYQKLIEKAKALEK